MSGGNSHQPFYLAEDEWLITRTSAKAYFFRFIQHKILHGRKYVIWYNELWIPRSIIRDWKRENGMLSFKLPTWFVINNELEEFVSYE